MNDIEIFELKKHILKDLLNELEYTVLPNIRANSKAHKEIFNLMAGIKLKVENYEHKINKYFEINENMYSNLKVKISTLKNIIKAKNELEVESISDMLDFLITNLHEIFLIDELVEIKPLELDKRIKNKFDKTKFYLSSSIEKSDILVYKIENIIIHKEKEYLDIKNYKKFNIDTEVIYFSPKYTLQDVDDFKLIWLLNNQSNEK